MSNTFRYYPSSNTNMYLVYPEVWGKESFSFYGRDTQTDLKNFACILSILPKWMFLKHKALKLIL